MSVREPSLHARYVQIEPTTRCNYTCGFCAGRQMSQGDLEPDTFDAVLAALPDLQHVELQGEGESLLHPRFFDMLAALRERQIRVSFITNGSLLSPDKVDRLLTLGVEKIAVSIESADADAFREIRGGKLEKVIRNVRHLIEERNRRGLDRPVVGFSVTVLQRTKDARSGIYALYRDLGLDGGITLQPLQVMPAYARHYGAAMADQVLGPVDADRVMARFFSDGDLRRIEAARSPVKGFYEEMSADWRAGSRRCPYLEDGLYVHRDGAVTACCMMKDTERHALGRLPETPVATLLERRQVMADQLAAGDVPEPCEGCALARFAVASKPSLAAFAVRGLVDRVLGR